MPLPASGFNPSVGTAGRLMASAASVDLLQAFPDYGTAPVRVTVAGVRSWQTKSDTETPRSLNFESPTTATGLVASRLPQGGTVKYTVSFEAECSATTAAISENTFAVGMPMVMDLIKDKNSTLGRYGVPVKILSIAEGPKTGAEVNLYQVEAEVDGVLPAFSFGA